MLRFKASPEPPPADTMPSHWGDKVMHANVRIGATQVMASDGCPEEQSAFKNFAQPVRALDEIHRVLRAGGTAVIQDLSKDASNAEIEQEVRAMKLSRLNAVMTKFVLATLLRRRAYSPVQFKRVVAASAFRTCEIRKDGIGLEVRLRKSAIEKVA